jgi:hypothetical protein
VNSTVRPRSARRSFGTAAALVLLLAGCSGSNPRNPPTPTPSPTATATDTASQSPAAGPRATSVVYGDRGELWLYDVVTDTVRRLTSDGEDPRQYRPQFRDSNTISYIQDATIFDLDTTGGKPRKVFKEGDDIRAFEWSPDGSSLAAIVLAGRAWRLSVLNASNGKVRDIKTVSLSDFGRGGVDDDETKLAWSPEGTKIAVVDTGALEASAPNFAGNTMLVVATDGSEPIPARRGSFARWSPDGTTIYYTDFMGAGRLFAVELASGTVTPLAATAPVRRPAPAPVGALIAYDDGNAATSVLVFNAATGATRRLGAGLAPLWLAPDVLMATNTRPCSGEECNEGPPWVVTGSTIRLPLSGATAPLKARTTLDADVRYA